MKLNFKTFTICTSLLLGVQTHIEAQVTIGSSTPPQQGALLQLKDDGDYINGQTATKGLMLPRVEITTLTPAANQLAESIGNTSGSSPWNVNDHIGLVVYNVKKAETSANRVCPGIHIWDGTSWQPLKPYLPVETTKTLDTRGTKSSIKLLGDYLNGFKTDATSTAVWTTLGKNKSDYPLTVAAIDPNTPKMTDADNNVYDSKRFYVAYQTTSGDKYKIVGDYSCAGDGSASETTYVTDPTHTDFIDGVWITSNVYSTQKASTGAFDQGSDIDNQPRLNPAWYDDPVAIKIGVGGLSTTATVTYGEDETEMTTTNKTVSQQVFAKTFGLSYTSNQANQVCPTGWHLPNYTDWSAIASAHGGIFNAATTMRKNYNFYLSGDGVQNQWSYKTTGTPSGFNAVPLGFVSVKGEIVVGFGTGAYWWEATPSTAQTYRSINIISSSLNSFTNAGRYFSVRCVKD